MDPETLNPIHPLKEPLWYRLRNPERSLFRYMNPEGFNSCHPRRLLPTQSLGLPISVVSAAYADGMSIIFVSLNLPMCLLGVFSNSFKTEKS